MKTKTIHDRMYEVTTIYSTYEVIHALHYIHNSAESRKDREYAIALSNLLQRLEQIDGEAGE